MLRSTLLLLALGTGACASGATTSRAQQPSPYTPEMVEAGRVADSIRNSATPGDIAFMSGMIGHHAQAIEMALLIPTHSTNESIKVLGGRIINAQRDEIDKMQTWLRNHGQPVPEAGGEHAMHHAMMPGMLSPAQMDELRAAQGDLFDRTFLKYMIQHHEGATAMVSTLFATPNAGQNDVVFKLASDVNVDQITEIARMRRMLFDLTINAAGP